MNNTAHTDLTFADRLRAARKVFGHTQMDACIEIGVALSTIAGWENAGIQPLGLQREAALAYIGKAEGQQNGQQSTAAK